METVYQANESRNKKLKLSLLSPNQDKLTEIVRSQIGDKLTDLKAPTSQLSAYR